MSPNDRQRIVRVPGSRRVKLTPAPGTVPEPDAVDETDDAPTGVVGASGPNDERMLRDVPPHY